MNERIKALMGKTLDSEFSHTWDTMTYEGLLQFSEKFAELIVRECIGKCDGNGEYKNHTDTEFGQGVAAGIKIAKAQIQIHFGVEE